MDTPRERALGFLYGLRELDVPVAAAVDALRVAGVLGADEAERWLAGQPPDQLPAPAGDEIPAQAAELLEELLASVPRDDDVFGPEVNRFEGALSALTSIGAADYEPWDERMRARAGQPTAAEEEETHRRLMAGGTEQELLAVSPGPDEVDGTRLLYAMRFADGISLVMRSSDSDDFWEFDRELRDDAGTTYVELGGSADGAEERLTFRPAPPEHARWIELVGTGPEPLRVEL
jgi:hypothetical protein